jgi:hypothetical protein
MKLNKIISSKLLGIAVLSMMMALFFAFAFLPADTNAEEIPPVITANTPFLTLEGSQTGNKATLKWNSIPEVSKIEVYGNYNKEKMKLIKTVTGNTSKGITFKKLFKKKINTKKALRFKLIAYHNVDGQNTVLVKSPEIDIAGSKLKGYINAKALTVTPAECTLQVGTTARITGKATKANNKANKKKKFLPAHYGPTVRYYSNNKSIATVGYSDGTVTGVAPGTCQIYACTLNGKTKIINVTVQ